MIISMLVQNTKRRNHLLILEGVMTYFVPNVKIVNNNLVMIVEKMVCWSVLGSVDTFVLVGRDMVVHMVIVMNVLGRK